MLIVFNESYLEESTFKKQLKYFTVMFVQCVTHYKQNNFILIVTFVIQI